MVYYDTCCHKAEYEFKSPNKRNLCQLCGRALRHGEIKWLIAECSKKLGYIFLFCTTHVFQKCDFALGLAGSQKNTIHVRGENTNLGKKAVFQCVTKTQIYVEPMLSIERSKLVRKHVLIMLFHVIEITCADQKRHTCMQKLLYYRDACCFLRSTS